VQLTCWRDGPGEVVGTAVVLPGAGYDAGMPLLYWSTRLLTQRGWQVWVAHWSGEEVAVDPDRIVVAAVEQAFAEAAGPARLIVAKSIGTRAAPWAKQRAIAGVWLTPLTGRPEIAAALSARDAPESLLVAGADDDLWVDPGPVGPRTAVLQMPRADHSLEIGANWRASLDQQRQVFEAIAAFADRVASPARPAAG
jgi:hypothetical protein